MKSLLSTILISLLLCGSFVATAQKAEVRKADKKFNNLQYIDAIDAYKAIVEDGYESEDVYQKLGDAYYFNAEYAQAATYYDRLFVLNENQSPVYQFRYGQSLKSIKDYKKADVYLSSFYKSIGSQYANSEDFIEKIKNKVVRYKVENSAFNTINSEYPGYLWNDQLYIIAANSGDIKNPWNGEPTTDIYSEYKGSLASLNNTINTKYNEGSLVITKDGNTMYFTRNNFLRKLRKGSDKKVNLKLYKASKVEGKWGDIVELPFNSDNYSVGHPALSTDEKTLYFVSDMPDDNIGGTDIYSVNIHDDNTYGAVYNVRPLNTVGNEMFPFMAPNGLLYFSSNGMQNNIGGLDIYSATPEGSTFKDVKNMGEPINSPFDDFAFVAMMDKDDLSGYMASNRTGSESDDIYKFSILEDCNQLISGVVKDKKTGDYLPNATVSLINDKNEILERIEANEFGEYKFENKGCDDYVKFVRGEQPKYQTNEVAVPDDVEKMKSLDILLDLREIDKTPGGDLAKLLNPIYFDLDKSNIRPDAEIELQKVIAILKQNPSIKIDVRSHTDSRASDAYNMNLSERRAQSTIAYITKNGIDANRLTGRGYGETQLVNKCSNGVSCSAAEHQQNRRSEFIIVE